MEAGNTTSNIYLDGDVTDWSRRLASASSSIVGYVPLQVQQFSSNLFTWQMTHDESDLYIVVTRRVNTNWFFPFEG